MDFTLEQLQAEPQHWRYFWQRSTGNCRFPLGDLAEIAFDFLDRTHRDVTSHDDRVTGGQIIGALNAINMYINSYPTNAYATCRRIGQYFSSPNINTAFGTIRQFEQPSLSRYIMFVSDLLVNVAACTSPTPSPVEMSVRGIAFLVLLHLDSQFAHWPTLRQARDECVHGLLAWGHGKERYETLLKSILRYTECAK